MHGLIASLSAQAAVLLSLSQTSPPVNPYVYTNDVGVKVEVLGACKIDEKDVVAWDVSGVKSASLCQRIVDQSTEFGGSALTFALYRKTRYLIVRMSGPDGIEIELSSPEEPNRTATRYKINPQLPSRLILYPFYAQEETVQASIKITAPIERTLVASLKPQITPKKDRAEVYLSHIERFQEGSVNGAMNYEWPILAYNDKAWCFFINVPQIQKDESYSITLSAASIVTPKYVDINGKPTEAAPDINVLRRLYKYNQDPDPKTFSDYARQMTIEPNRLWRVLLTNINPRYISGIAVYRLISRTTAFSNIPIEPIDN